MNRLFALAAALPALVAAANPPKFIAFLEHGPIAARLPGRTLGAWIVKADGGRDGVFEILSRDNGRTWPEPRPVHTLAGKAGTWGGPQSLLDRNGRVHLFLLRMSKYTMGAKGEGERPEFDDYKGNRIDIWHMRSDAARTSWTEPREIWAGYTGALNSAVAMRTGRILLPFSYFVSRPWGNRGTGFAAFTFFGQFNSTLVYSDDGGDSFRLSPVPLAIETPDIVSAYGAVEPVMVELKDGRVWNLIRTQRGRFYESFSTDGANWTDPEPSKLLSSDSPAGLVRTDDGKLVLVWNNCLRFPYAHGGRQVLHAAVSENEGATWTGFREVLKDPKRDQPPPPGGDFGTAYPFPAAAFDGEILIRSGQGKGRTALLSLDPRWLYEKTQRSDFARNLDDWTYFGCKGVERVPHPSLPGRYTMRVAKTDAAWPAGAVWNFPNGVSGKLTMRYMLRTGFRGANVALTDHYSVPWDKEDHLHSLWNIPLDAAPEAWRTMTVEWSIASRAARVSIDGGRAAPLSMRRETMGANYLRIRSTAGGIDSAGMLVESVDVSVEPK